LKDAQEQINGQKDEQCHVEMKAYPLLLPVCTDPVLLQYRCSDETALMAAGAVADEGIQSINDGKNKSFLIMLLYIWVMICCSSKLHYR